MPRQKYSANSCFCFSQCQQSRGWVCEEGIKRNMQPLNGKLHWEISIPPNYNQFCVKNNSALTLCNFAFKNILPSNRLSQPTSRYTTLRQQHFFPLKFPHKSYSYHTESPQCVDPLSRRVFKKGEMWRLSECAHCVCGESNAGSCSVVRCPTPRCNDPFKIKGICCPACPQDYQEGWLHCASYFLM